MRLNGWWSQVAAVVDWESWTSDAFLTSRRKAKSLHGYLPGH